MDDKDKEHPLKTLHDEVIKIGMHAIDVIYEVMLKNRMKHSPYSWMRTDLDDHIQAAFRHAVKSAIGKEVTDGEVNLDHLLCRAAMAVYVRDKVKTKEEGEDDC